jgi:hypothetical protein
MQADLLKPLKNDFLDEKTLKMNNLLGFGLSLSLSVFGGLACQTNPLAKYTKQ